MFIQRKCAERSGRVRDTYLKETEKRSGSAAGSGKKWKYSAVLSFLDPFVSPRDTSGNMERGDGENQAAGYEDQGETEAAAAGQSETGGVLTSEATQQGIYVVVVFYDEKSKLISL